MDFEILQENLHKSCLVAARFVGSKSAIPILSSFLIKAKKEGLEILATNLESSIKISTGAKINQEGNVALPIKTFLEYLTSINPQKISLKQEGQKLQLLGEQQTKASFVTIKPDEFPKFPEIRKEKLLSLEKNALKKLIQQTTFAAASDEGRPVLTGVLIKLNKNQLSFVTTDGFRLSESLLSLPNSENNNDFQLIVPALALNELERLLGEVTLDEVSVFLTQEENQVAFSLGNFLLITRLLEAEYPAYEKVIPAEFNWQALVSTLELQKAVKTAAIFAGRDSQTIKVNFNPASNEILLTGESVSLGESETRLLGEVQGREEIKMAFNARFLQEGLSSIKTDQVQIQIKERVAPTLFSSPEDETYKHIIMPIRFEQEPASA